MAYVFRPYKIPTYKSLESSLAKQYKLPRYEDALKRYEGYYLRDLMRLPGRRKSIREAEYEKYGIPGLEQEYTGIRRDVQAREAQYEQQQGKITEKPLSMAAITGQEAALSRNRAIEMNSLYTKRDVIAGDLERAKGYASEAIGYAIEDEMAKIAAMEQQVNIRQNQLGRVKDKYQVALESALQDRSLKLQSNIALKELTANTWLELQKQYPRARLNGRMTIEQMMAAVRPYASEREALELAQMRAQVAQIRANTGGGSSYRGTTDYQNWALAGGQKGTGKTFAQWLADGGSEEIPSLKSAKPTDWSKTWGKVRHGLTKASKWIKNSPLRYLFPFGGQ